ncbi:DNA-directed RNA polymerases I, II, and III subunit RPABC2 [Dictyocoela muelleri]|nr:DNA-directed RNA polymerases I, II, and III subunit RPABC2 [Dictyocoela muelleri]
MESDYESSTLSSSAEIQIFEAKKEKNIGVRVTTPIMTKFEKAYIIGMRAMQLSMNAPPTVDIENMTDPLQIAIKEFNENKIPFVIERKLPDGSVEFWRLDELIKPDM